MNLCHVGTLECVLSFQVVTIKSSMAFILILIFRITDGISFKQKNYITETI